MLWGQITHLETAIYESDEGAGEIEASLDLCDGALHVGAGQRFGEVGKGQCHDEQLATEQDKRMQHKRVRNE